jgi:hypothetical protein
MNPLDSPDSLGLGAGQGQGRKSPGRAPNITQTPPPYGSRLALATKNSNAGGRRSLQVSTFASKEPQVRALG